MEKRSKGGKTVLESLVFGGEGEIFGKSLRNEKTARREFCVVLERGGMGERRNGDSKSGNSGRGHEKPGERIGQGSKKAGGTRENKKKKREGFQKEKNRL